MGKKSSKKQYREPVDEIREVFVKAVKKSGKVLVTSHYDYEFDWAIAEDLHERITKAIQDAINVNVYESVAGPVEADVNSVDTYDSTEPEYFTCDEEPCCQDQDDILFETTVDASYEEDEVMDTIDGLFARLFEVLEENNDLLDKVKQDSAYLEGFLGDNLKKDVSESASADYKGFPLNTTVNDMTPVEKAAYWKNMSRKWESRAKENLKKADSAESDLNRAKKLLNEVTFTVTREHYGQNEYSVSLPGFSNPCKLDCDDVNKALINLEAWSQTND